MPKTVTAILIADSVLSTALAVALLVYPTLWQPYYPMMHVLDKPPVEYRKHRITGQIQSKNAYHDWQDYHSP